ncbi:hypothetical protein [Variovorax sp. EBFNA2]|uniref:hypothetical protein n=1 Tax=Variovorax sp. EBFNA2 TaxID=3342097 RepID=UPI0029C0D521|nr:hypothetical protein [Variovorax boronicumulans]WPG41668.1 hypothetical protein RZE79_32100 [Variovorax boronicumulans]
MEHIVTPQPLKLAFAKKGRGLQGRFVNIVAVRHAQAAQAYASMIELNGRERCYGGHWKRRWSGSG